MNALSMIDLILMLFGLVNAAWIAFLYILSRSEAIGTKTARKLGEANEEMDKYLEKEKRVSDD